MRAGVDALRNSSFFRYVMISHCVTVSALWNSLETHHTSYFNLCQFPIDLAYFWCKKREVKKSFELKHLTKTLEQTKHYYYSTTSDVPLLLITTFTISPLQQNKMIQLHHDFDEIKITSMEASPSPAVTIRSCLKNKTRRQKQMKQRDSPAQRRVQFSPHVKISIIPSNNVLHQQQQSALARDRWSPSSCEGSSRDISPTMASRRRSIKANLISSSTSLVPYFDGFDDNNEEHDVQVVDLVEQHSN